MTQSSVHNYMMNVFLFDRLSHLQSLAAQLDSPDMLRLVPVDHFNMAIQGLSNLLRTGNQSVSNTKSDWSSQSHVILNDINKGDNSENTRVTRYKQSDLEDAVLILPLINDYLRHYIEMLESTFENLATTSTMNSSSSPDSFDTSSESPTGSLGLFLRNTASYANDLEGLTIASLNTLHVLLSCVDVRRLLFVVEVKVSLEAAAPADTEVCVRVE